MCKMADETRTAIVRVAKTSPHTQLQRARPFMGQLFSSTTDGAVGAVEEFVFPVGFGPNPDDTKKCTPLCVIVHFDEVSLPVGNVFYW